MLIPSEPSRLMSPTSFILDISASPDSDWNTSLHEIENHLNRLESLVMRSCLCGETSMASFAEFQSHLTDYVYDSPHVVSCNITGQGIELVAAGLPNLTLLDIGNSPVDVGAILSRVLQ